MSLLVLLVVLMVLSAAGISGVGVVDSRDADYTLVPGSSLVRGVAPVVAAKVVDTPS